DGESLLSLRLCLTHSPPLPLFVACLLFFSNYTPTPDIYPLSLHDALPISPGNRAPSAVASGRSVCGDEPSGRQDERKSHSATSRSEEHTSELQSLTNLVCRLLLEKKKPNL